MLTHSILNDERRAILSSRCSKTITQYKFDLMSLTIATATDITRGHAQAALEMKNRLLQLESDATQSSTELVIKAIEERVENMKKRAEQLLRYKLRSFFDLAPTEDNEDGSVAVGAISLFLQELLPHHHLLKPI